MKHKVDIETSVISYLTARPSNDLRAMANQNATAEWWETQRSKYDLVIALPAKAEVDAYHVAIAAVNGVEYLLTWNCTHIANAHTRPKIEAACRSLGYEPPVICTPDELTEI